MKRAILFIAVLLLLSMPALAAPSKPTNLVATPNRCRDYNFTWTPSTPSAGLFITFYDLYMDGVDVADVSFSTCPSGTCSATYWSLNILPGSTHSFQVRAHESQGALSPISDPAIATTVTPCADLTAPGAPGTPTLDSADGKCSQQFLNWTSATDTGGAGIHHYQIFENDVLYNENIIPVNQFNGFSSRVPGFKYTYKLRAIDKDGNIGPFSGTLDVSPDCSTFARIGSKSLVVIPVKFSDRAAEPMSVDQLNTVMALWKSWLQQISYGQFTINTTILGWNYTLPKPVLISDGGYCNTLSQDGKGYGVGCNFQAANSDASVIVGTADDGYDYKAFYYNAMLGGFTGAPTITIGTEFFNLDTFTHEGGHLLGDLQHSSSYYCGGEVDGIGPNLLHLNTLLDPLASPCNPSTVMTLYGGTSDTMGSSTHGYSSLHRELMGWLGPSNRQVALKTGDYDLEAVNVPGTGIKEIRIPTNIHGYYYFINFRKSIGFDADLLEGIYVYLHLNSFQGIDGDQFQVTPRFELSGQPNKPDQVIGSGQFDDPYRNIHITHIATNGNVATVHITMDDRRPGPRAKTHAAGIVKVH